MNAQQLEYIRIRLRSALLDDSGGTKGQLEAFSEHPPADKNGYTRHRMHKVELEGGHQVYSDNSAVYVMETRSRRQPLPPMKEFAYAHCAWRRAVRQLDEHQQAWLKYCYGWDLSFKLQTLICQHVWETYEKKLAGTKLQKRVKLRLVLLVWLAVQDVAAKNWNDQYTEYAATALANLMSISRETWYQTYATPWQVLKGIASNLDEGALIDAQVRVGSHYADD